MHEVTPSLGTRPRRALAERMAEKIIPEPNSGCWLWTGAVNPGGYGVVTAEVGCVLLAHRASYEIHVGPIPDGMQLDHLCRVRCCVNPAHLEPVTNRENAIRGICGEVRKIRAAKQTHCKRGHLLVAPNLRPVAPGAKPVRACRTCSLLREKKKRAERFERENPGMKFRFKNYKSEILGRVVI